MGKSDDKKINRNKGLNQNEGDLLDLGESEAEILLGAGQTLSEKARVEVVRVAEEARNVIRDNMPVISEDPETPEYQRQNAQITERYQKYLDAFSSLDTQKINEVREKYRSSSSKDIFTKTSRDLIFEDLAIATDIAENVDSLMKELGLNKEADLLRMLAYVDMPFSPDGFFKINYPPSQELSVGFGEWIPKEILQIEYKASDSSDPILAQRGIIDGRICFVEENGKYLASYSGDRVKLIPPGEEVDFANTEKRVVPTEEDEWNQFYFQLVEEERKARGEFVDNFNDDGNFKDGAYNNPEGYGESVTPIRGLEGIAEELKNTTPVDLNWYIDRARKFQSENKGISKENSRGMDFGRWSKYGVDKGPLKCARFVSEVLGISPSEGSIRNLFPRILAGLEEKTASVEATNKYSDFKEGSVYAMLFYEQETRDQGGKWLSHIALGAVTTINGARCIVASHEGKDGATIVVNVLSGNKPSSSEIGAHLKGNSDTFLAKMGNWYNDSSRAHDKIRVQENKANVYWSDNGARKAFQFAVNVDSIVNV